MTTPDRLERVLVKLEAMERAAQDFCEGRSDDVWAPSRFAPALHEQWPFLHAKLRVAVEMEKGCGSAMWVIQNHHNKDLPEWEGYAAAAEDDIRASPSRVAAEGARGRGAKSFKLTPRRP